MHFQKFAAIDWSGAKGSRHKGIALAICSVGAAAPVLVSPPGGVWSRTGVAEWIEAHASEALLIGMDFSFAPPCIIRGSYLPGENVPATGPDFWRYVDSRSNDPDLGAASFLEIHHRPHFYFGAADGIKSDFMHLRRCEAQYNAAGGGKPSTVYDAIGAAQVAKASFAGMRLLHRLKPNLPVWPFDPLPHNGALIVEIYTAIAARAAGRPKGRTKIRTPAALDEALALTGSDPHAPLAHYDDHATDAILTAAWLRANAANPALWAPASLTAEIAVKEGWTFGVA